MGCRVSVSCSQLILVCGAGKLSFEAREQFLGALIADGTFLSSVRCSLGSHGYVHNVADTVHFLCDS